MAYCFFVYSKYVRERWEITCADAVRVTYYGTSDLRSGTWRKRNASVTPCAWTCDFAGCNYATPRPNITRRSEIILWRHARPSLFSAARCFSLVREFARNLDRAIASTWELITALSLHCKSMKPNNELPYKFPRCCTKIVCLAIARRER